MYKEQIKQFIATDEFQSLKNKLIDNQKYYYDYLIDTYTKSDLSYIYRCMLESGYNNAKTSSTVYFIRNKYNNLLKIGKTNNLARRINEIKNCFNFLGLDENELEVEAISYCPYGLSNSKVETYYHNIFKDKRIKGEWFNVSFDDLFQNLTVDYFIDGMIITIEDELDYDTNFYGNMKFTYTSNDDLNEEITNYILTKCGLSQNHFDIFSFKTKDKNSVNPKDMYNFLCDCVKENIILDVDKLIRNNINSIINQIDNNQKGAV